MNVLKQIELGTSFFKYVLGKSAKNIRLREAEGGACFLSLNLFILILLGIIYGEKIVETGCLHLKTT